MPAREQGLRRIAAVTVGMTLAAAVGSVAAAAAAWAHTRDVRASTTPPASTGGTVDSGTGTGTSNDAPLVTPDDGAPHATSGGS